MSALLTVFNYYLFSFIFNFSNMSIVILSRLYSALKPHSLIAADGSMASGQLSAIAWRIGSTSYVISKSGSCFFMDAAISDGSKLIAVTLNALR